MVRSSFNIAIFREKGANWARTEILGIQRAQVHPLHQLEQFITSDICMYQASWTAPIPNMTIKVSHYKYGTIVACLIYHIFQNIKT